MAKNKLDRAKQMATQDVGERKNLAHLDQYQKHFQRKEITKPVATRLRQEDLEALKNYAVSVNKRLSAVLQEWILEKMDELKIRENDA